MPGAEVPFDTFVVANADGLLRTAYLLAWDEQEAEDLVQECLFKLAPRWSQVSAMQQPLAYARRVLINLATDGAKRRSRRRAELDGALRRADGTLFEIGGEASELTRLETIDEVTAALGELPPRQRAVLVLRYFLDLSEVETARALGCTTGTVKSTAAKALARMRARLEPLPEVGEP
jgi:RNA polymerase sigma-70 factor (sigma-E family)